MGLINLLKKLPIDLGQGEMKRKTKGKLIGFSYIPEAESAAKSLDIGCRDGFWSKKMQEKGYEVFSIDLEPCYSPAEKVDVNEGLPYPDNFFKVVWCAEVIEHLKDPQAALAEMLRVVKHGGRIILTTPNSYFLLLRLFYLLGQTPAKLQNPGHLHFFNKNTFCHILPPNVEVFGFFPHFLLRCKIRHGIGLLSPTLVAIIKKD